MDSARRDAIKEVPDQLEVMLGSKVALAERDGGLFRVNAEEGLDVDAELLAHRAKTSDIYVASPGLISIAVLQLLVACRSRFPNKILCCKHEPRPKEEG